MFTGTYSRLDAYQPLVLSASAKYALPENLLNALIFTESSGDPLAEGPPVAKLGGETAKGLLQFIPETAKQYDVNPYDPASSIWGAAKYLSDLHATYGNWQDALAAYKGNAKSNQAQGYASEVIALQKQFNGNASSESASNKNASNKTAGAPVIDAGTPATPDASQNFWAEWWNTILGVLGGGMGYPVEAGNQTAAEPGKDLGSQISSDVGNTVDDVLDSVWGWLAEGVGILATVLLVLILGYLGIKAAISGEATK